MTEAALSLKLVPKISEKALAEIGNKSYVFIVPKSASKTLIKSAVEKQFDVTVKTVRTAVMKGKSKSSFQKRRQSLAGKRADYKKAFVSLSKGSIKEIEEAFDAS